MSHDPEQALRTQAARQRMEKLAWLLDGVIRVPGTRFRFGLDSLIGLLPGVGDIAGMLLGAGILYQGVRVGAPRNVIVKMLRNLAMDAAGGLIPVVGDLFDFAYKAHRRNADLLIEHLDRVQAQNKPHKRGSTIIALLLAGAFVAVSATLLWLLWSWLLG